MASAGCRLHKFRHLLPLQKRVKLSSIASHTSNQPQHETVENTGVRASAFPPRFSIFTKNSPCFPVNASQIHVVREPCDFYSILKTQANRAQKRIVLSSLYLNTGTFEQDLIDVIYRNCESARKHGRQFEVVFLFDYFRGSRGERNTRTMCQRLLKDFGDCVRVFLYHSPDLRGLLKTFTPERFNEIVGVTHLKVYLFDDSLIMSGANLDDKYFTQRQDRYIQITDTDLSDFFASLIQTVSTFSLELSADNTMSVDANFGVHPITGDKDDFKDKAKISIETLLQKFKSTHNGHYLVNNIESPVLTDQKPLLVENNKTDDSTRQNCIPGTTLKRQSVESSFYNISGDSKRTKSNKTNKSSSPPSTSKTATMNQKDTWIFPLIQMGPLGIFHDEEMTLELIRNASDSDTIRLGSGYFNLTEQYKQAILHESAARYHLMLASPETNGFYQAKGIARHIPSVYLHLTHQFYNNSHKSCVSLYEYMRDSWSFHVKGLWYYLDNDPTPSLTLVGSTNFGYRSIHRDLEAQVAIVTTNDELKQSLHQENERLFKRSQRITDETFKRTDRHVPLWVKCITPIIKSYF